MNIFQKQNAARQIARFLGGTDGAHSDAQYLEAQAACIAEWERVKADVRSLSFGDFMVQRCAGDRMPLAASKVEGYYLPSPQETIAGGTSSVPAFERAQSDCLAVIASQVNDMRALAYADFCHYAGYAAADVDRVVGSAPSPGF